MCPAMKKVTRKEFLVAGAATLTSVALGAGCAGDDGGGSDGEITPTPSNTVTPTPTSTPTGTPTPTPTAAPSPTPFGDCMANGTTVTIQNPHSHTMVVPAADVIAGTQKDYDITGGNVTHGHVVTLTAAHFTQLQMNFQVVVQSGAGGGHTHTVTVRCVA